MSFYITRLPPGKAGGSDTWTEYEQEIELDELHNAGNTGISTEEIEEEFDDTGQVRPLDFFFPER